MSENRQELRRLIGLAFWPFFFVLLPVISALAYWHANWKHPEVREFQRSIDPSGEMERRSQPPLVRKIEEFFKSEPNGSNKRKEQGQTRSPLKELKDAKRPPSDPTTTYAKHVYTFCVFGAVGVAADRKTTDYSDEKKLHELQLTIAQIEKEPVVGVDKQIVGLANDLCAVLRAKIAVLKKWSDSSSRIGGSFTEDWDQITNAQLSWSADAARIRANLIHAHEGLPTLQDVFDLPTMLRKQKELTAAIDAATKK